MSTSNSETETFSTHTEDVEVLELMTKDIVDVKEELEVTIDNIKENIKNLFLYVSGTANDTEPVSSHSSFRRDESVREEMNSIIETSILELHKKTVLDLRFVQLYDQFLAKELGLKIKNECVEKKLGIAKDRMIEHFLKLNEETEKAVEATKSRLEKYLEINNDGNMNIFDTEVFTRFRKQAFDDLQKCREKTRKDVQRTKRMIMDNIGVFWINPTGPKTVEELESEQFVKDQIVTLKEAVEKDLKASKQITEEIAKRTKQAIENLTPRSETNSCEDGRCETFDFTIDNLRNKTIQDFNVVNEEIDKTVSQIKESVKTCVRDANSNAAMSHQRENTPFQENDEYPLESSHVDKLKNDFQVIDDKMKEEANDLKIGIADLVNNVKQKLQQD